MRWSTHLKGHLLQFGPKPSPEYDGSTGLRLLGIAFVFEALIGPRFGLFNRLGAAPPPIWMVRPLQIALVLTAARAFGVRPRQLGLCSWARWNPIQKSWFVQGILLATVVFALVSEPVRVAARTPALWAAAFVALPTSLAWGFYQELVYRSLVQTELVRRWGVVGGILAANGLYTFGPLHFYHIADRGFTGAAPMMTAIFAIGLYFGLLFDRTRNLWMVGLFHGLGNWYTGGLSSVVDR